MSNYGEPGSIYEAAALDPAVEDDGGYYRKGLGTAYLSGEAPPARRMPPAPSQSPTEEGFRRARETEAARQRQGPAGVPDDELREWDAEKLRALMGEDLTEWEADAFPDMLARLDGGRYPLTPRQREKVDDALDRLGLDVPRPEELRGVRRHGEGAPAAPPAGRGREPVRAQPAPPSPPGGPPARRRV